jgi:hypothetical protein
MTVLLEKAMAEARTLSPEAQDAIAELILGELQDEQIWQQAFGNTSEEQWSRLADMVRAEIVSGTTQPLDMLPL